MLGVGTLGRVLQRRPEETELRFSARRSLVLRLEGNSAPGDLGALIGACFAGILAETLKPGPMAQGVAESRLPVLLVHLQGQAGDIPAPSSLAARFAALVEAHFRDR